MILILLLLGGSYIGNSTFQSENSYGSTHELDIRYMKQNSRVVKARIFAKDINGDPIPYFSVRITTDAYYSKGSFHGNYGEAVDGDPEGTDGGTLVYTFRLTVSVSFPFTIHMDLYESDPIHYLDSTSSIMNALETLDSSIKSTETEFNNRSYIYTSSTALSTHSITHNLNTDYPEVTVLVYDTSTSKYKQDVASVIIEDSNTLSVVLSSSKNVKVIIRGLSDLNI